MVKRIFAISVLIALLIFTGYSTEDEPTPDMTEEQVIDVVNLIMPQKTQKISNPTATPTPEKSPNPKSHLKGKIICIDAGHGVSSVKKQEPIAPNVSQTKPAMVSGTRGATQTEEQLTLKVSLKLQKALEEKGSVVLMTRTTNKSNITNIERAQMANEAGADLSIRIHADGNNSSRLSGMSMLVPTGEYIKDATLIEESREAGETVLAEIIKSTGAKNRGISPRSDMTGFNWSTVPVILLEMGFMTNPDEDRLLATDDYQNKIVQGILNGLEKYYSQ